MYKLILNESFSFNLFWWFGVNFIFVLRYLRILKLFYKDFLESFFGLYVYF